MCHLTRWFGLLLLLGNSRWRLLLVVVVGAVGSRDTYMRPHPKLYLSIPRDASQAPMHASSHRVYCGCATSRAWFCLLLLLLGGMVAAMCNSLLVVLVARSIRYLCASGALTALLANHGHFGSRTVSHSSAVIGAFWGWPGLFLRCFLLVSHKVVPIARPGAKKNGFIRFSFAE